MAAGDLVQKGTQFEVGFGSYTYSNVQMDDVTLEPIANVNPVKGNQDATITKMLSDPGKRITITGAILNASTHAELTAIAAMKKGDTITINTVAYCIESVQIKLQRLQAIATIAAVKEDSMTYT